MKPDKSIIIRLLIHTMRKEQDRIEQDNAQFFTISGIIAELMGIPEQEITWEWFDIYMSHLNQASQYEITEDSKNLLPLAEACYTALTKCVNREKTTEKQ